jgi:hypothetical protein
MMRPPPIWTAPFLHLRGRGAALGLFGLFRFPRTGRKRNSNRWISRNDRRFVTDKTSLAWLMDIVMEQLRAIRASLDGLTAKLDRIDERLAFVETRIGHIEISEGHANAVLGQVNLRLLHIE